jgi:hypothetical protein
VLEVDTLTIDGPLAFLFGARHYRLVSLGVDDTVVVAGSAVDVPSIHVFPSRQGILDGGGSGNPVLGYIGISRLRLRSLALPAEDLAQGSYILKPDGSLASIIR